MAERPNTSATAEERPSPEGSSSWPTYWKALGQPWRYEPGIVEARQRYLAEHRAIQPDIKEGIYPFGGVTLTRADVEWLLATHESGGLRGPVDWHDATQHTREGIDLRGAVLKGAVLSELPLAKVRCGLDVAEWGATSAAGLDAAAAHVQQCMLVASHVEGACLNRVHLERAECAAAHLEQATLVEAHLEQTDLFGTHLEGAVLTRAHLAGAKLDMAVLDSATDLSDVV